MAKSKVVFICRNCGFESAKWLGKCTSCGEWNTFVEELQVPPSKTTVQMPGFAGSSSSKPIKEISVEKIKRIHTFSNELDRVLGGGIVPGSLILIGGEPGIGKSTISLQVAVKTQGLKVLYISGEESNEQMKMRADRIGIENENCFLCCETSLEAVFNQVQEVQPDLLFIDSIQTLQTNTIESSAGSIVQIRECTGMLQRYAKASGTPVILIGHINKEGVIAGPKVMEHIVDTVLQFEGDTKYLYRVIRAMKNRFGSTSELGIFEMHSTGLVEVTNPSEILISQTDDDLSGVAVSSTVDGLRTFLIEVQALVSTAVYGTPQRSATGYDVRRLNMLLAVLEKRVGFKLGHKDVFLNITGGIKVNDPAIDLAVIAAVLSSNIEASIDKKTCFAGEVGLSGEIRPVSHIDLRMKEAYKLGFKRMLISKYNKKTVAELKDKIEIVAVSKVEEVVRTLFK